MLQRKFIRHDRIFILDGLYLVLDIYFIRLSMWEKTLTVILMTYYSEDKSKFPAGFTEDMKNVAKEKFAWKATDNVEKKVAECVKQLKDTLEKRRLVSYLPFRPGAVGLIHGFHCELFGQLFQL